MDKHIEFLPRLAAYHDGALEAGEHASVKAHVEQCPQCRAILDDWGAIDKGLKTLEDQPDVDVKADVLARIAALPSRGRLNFVFQKPYWSMAAAAVLLIFSATFWLQNKEKPGAPATPPAAVQTPQSEASTAPPPLATAPAPSVSAETTTLQETRREKSETAAAPVTIAQAESGSALKQDSSADAASTAAKPHKPAPSSQEMMAFEIRSDMASPAMPETASESLAPRVALSGIEQTGRTFSQPSTTAAAPRRAEVSGVLQQEWPPRLVEETRIYYRIPDLYEPAFVEVNLLPLFEAEFVAVGYAAADLLDDSYDITVVRPTRLSSQAAYLVANLRLERAALLARMHNQVRSADAGQRLADLTWQLANLTVDQDDVRHAIAAQDASMRQNPSLAVQARARMVHLRTLVIK
jgi:anti-sigma factor ChrR (cupin superfamily)